MDCNDYRRLILAEPRSDVAALQEHRTGCHDCAEFTVRLLRFEDRLGSALRVDGVGSRAGLVVPLRPRRTAALVSRPRWLAAAASVLLAVGVAGVLWLATPGPTLAADVVQHMAEEPDAWQRTDVAIALPKLSQVFRDSALRLKGPAGLVSYANACTFRGHKVPHFVVQTAAGPVTVMVLAHESSKAVVRFDDHGYRGLIVPVPGHGSIAVLERGAAIDTAAVAAVATQVQAAVDWSI